MKEGKSLMIGGGIACNHKDFDDLCLTCGGCLGVICVNCQSRDITKNCSYENRCRCDNRVSAVARSRGWKGLW